ncbi:MAG: HNH endonuclease [Hyphomicrobiales bacterium]|nr:HNH endonuclease [Hyphomicrobiales bacterium]
MGNTSALDRAVWSEFFEHMDQFLEPTDLQGRDGFEETQQALHEVDCREGIDSVGLAKRRINQNFFRAMIIASFDSQCAMTGISDRRLLVASHIEPWAKNAAKRLDPRNGLCLNYVHDAAFEKGLIAVAPDFSILYSSQLPEIDHKKLRSVSHEKLTLPDRFKPDPALLEKHRKERFLG